ncbi:RDD family protein [Leminorella grimontii]|uniref:RDD family protein n=1 Tax=Leminorella grimontii TaxID=82981 RepID=A0AAV5N4V2_9GAMM|nr:RDD family protein [Leminorella grimontii]KFC94488.1 rhomboid family integral membrane protein [Leminorella grimontii ATCC 33999 = DSM 5078]GKX56585.1 RDD family protein [Leminorella grimontii]VFS61692.1 RDD family [Leminorella grimontii]
MLDTVRDVTTPELIEIQLHPAGFLSRGFAFFIDTLIRWAIIAILSIPALFMGKMGIGIGLIVLFLIEWFYPVFFEVLFNGRTPGKRLAGLKVLHDNGTPVGLSASIIRNFLRFADFLPLCYLFGLLSMLINKEFRRLGDIVAGTIVVYSVPPTSYFNVPQAPPLQPDLPLSRETQKAVVSFAGRSSSLTGPRQEELASLLPTLSKPEGSEVQGAARLIGIANFLIGRKP